MLPHGERRQRVRHKLHTPVYASFGGPKQGMVLDLSELLDLHDDGFAVRTSAPLEVNCVVNVCLDLPETKAYVHGTGYVVWSDATGRAGIRLSGLAEQPRRLLKEWLFINLLIVAANHAARSQQLAHVEEETQTPIEVVTEAASIQTSSDLEHAGPVADLSSLLFAVDAVRRELRSRQDDFDAAVQLLTERAVSLTGATGGALAISTNGEMVCRASTGEPAPPVQSIVDVKQGFSGECVRNARTAVCEDAESDPRLDRELCRFLGIRSILAAPIVSNFRTVGLLEVLSPAPRAFAKIHEIVLERLAELVPQLQPPPSQPQRISVNESESSETPGAAAEDLTGDAYREKARDEVSIRWVPFSLLAAALALAALGLGYALAPTIEQHWLTKPEASVQAASPEAAPSSDRGNPGPLTLDQVRKLAEQGDADAQWNLGTRYHHGDGVSQDDSVAVQWFQRAAEQGNVTAQGTLGAYYWAGRGVQQDLSKAYFWSALAMAQGDETSKSRVEGLASQMTRSDVLSARQQAEDWIRQHTRAAKAN